MTNSVWIHEKVNFTSCFITIESLLKYLRNAAKYEWLYNICGCIDICQVGFARVRFPMYLIVGKICYVMPGLKYISTNIGWFRYNLMRMNHENDINYSILTTTGLFYIWSSTENIIFIRPCGVTKCTVCVWLPTLFYPYGLPIKRLAWHSPCVSSGIISFFANVWGTGTKSQCSGLAP